MSRYRSIVGCLLSLYLGAFIGAVLFDAWFAMLQTWVVMSISVGIYEFCWVDRGSKT